jgi:hypothetical protein
LGAMHLDRPFGDAKVARDLLVEPAGDPVASASLVADAIFSCDKRQFKMPSPDGYEHFSVPRSPNLLERDRSDAEVGRIRRLLPSAPRTSLP